jgi:hypothetical protein
MARRSSVPSGRQFTLLTPLLVLACLLVGCPPYFVAFRPDLVVGLRNLVLTREDASSVQLQAETVNVAVSALRWQYSGGYIDVKLEFEQGRKSPIELRTAGLYVTDDGDHRFDLYELQHDGGATGWVAAYRGAPGERQIEDTYVLDTDVKQVRLTFAADFKHFPENVVLHLEGIEAGGQSLAFVYRYRVDCEELRKERHRIQILFKSVGPFEVCR